MYSGLLQVHSQLHVHYSIKVVACSMFSIASNIIMYHAMYCMCTVHVHVQSCILIINESRGIVPYSRKYCWELRILAD